jgi:aminoglycoside phosphotransferase (APT) family kinase protein
VNIKSAHDMGREFRILSALAPSWPKAPRPLAHCDDAAVIGSPFYVMERVRGVVLRAKMPEGVALDEATMRRASEAACDTLAEIHNLDWKAAGLGDLGKPDGYVRRQVDGWIERWNNALTPDVSPVEPFVGWLRQTVPLARRATLVHNDYKLDNTLLDAAHPDRTVAVLDWDMCTRGEPLMDLGELLCLWGEAGDGHEGLHGRMPTWLPGFITRREVAERYACVSGADLSDLNWYVVFNMFRFAVILQQIYVRYVRGQTHDERFAHLGTAVNQITQRGLEAIDAQEF